MIQAYSRTNRLLNSDKPHGNIVSFRNLKEATDKSLELFGDENAKEVVFKKPYEEQKKEFEVKLTELRELAPTANSVNELISEADVASFVKTFRDLLRVKSSLETFAEFTFEDIGIKEQEFYDYQSKYLDIHDSRKSYEGEMESILDEIDFELELTVRDIVNFDYIIQLIAGLKDTSSESAREKKTEEILRLFDRDVKLRKKKELIKKFIEENLPKVKHADDVEKAFHEFWESERANNIKTIAQEADIPIDKFEHLIGEFLYTQRLPREQEIADAMKEQPRIRERSKIISRIKDAMENLFEIFEW